MPSLGQMLRSAREARGLSLRDVERATEGKVSNGYLSLLESDSVKQPSPNHLYHLAQAYRLDYAELMRLAGYFVPNPSTPASGAHHGGAGASRITRSAGLPGRPTPPPASGIALSADGLAPEDVADIERYAEFLRARRQAAPGPSAAAPGAAAARPSASETPRGERAAGDRAPRSRASRRGPDTPDRG
ncbi:helix-turn-helix domain-containing protein [Roseisolibacter agri]|uniref:HTH cro/C1-type domain-containing protein n=1 Tax=Roseisolibacter agri TaxID=2014610 RepID=A0AA37QG29_9BACT|nr:helix-turn-helix transcriptional regulator [Roseisolibacter agri]GLC28251.1 hypothetical protein rosag_47640 [Roseisolibacter agri]